MFFQRVDLTTALRPSLLPDESLLFVQDAVGLYEGKYKIPNYQCGHAYLTSHRICYVDVEDRQCSVAIDLKDVDRIEFQARFLRSSPKISVLPKKRRARQGISSAPHSSPLRVSSPARTGSIGGIGSITSDGRTATWVCPICSFSNPVPSNFDPSATATAIPPCLACGIKPPLTTVLKAAIASARPPPTPVSTSTPISASTPTTSTTSTGEACPRCTFVNHPSLQECEICGAGLQASSRGRSLSPGRAGSPAPFLTSSRQLENTEIVECIKLSFRAGGERAFHERLKGALIQRKWILQDAPPIPKSFKPSAGDRLEGGGGDTTLSTARSTAVGIAGLERRGLETRKNNEAVIGGAFEDLEALMASAKEVVALAESFSRAEEQDESQSQSAVQSAAALGMVTTKDMLGSTSSLYISELSRNLAEYLTDERQAILPQAGGIMSLIDLWAVFNRARNGVELVSPTDFFAAAEQWEKLRLPVRLRRFKSGLLVVQRHDWTDEQTLRQLEAWFEELRRVAPESEVAWDWRAYGRGVTAYEAGQRFGWSVGVASEELEMAEDRGLLCREQGIEGLRFWYNHLHP
ncbi:uncharacterized protein GIQ15_06142 [Arthroderma uncinatum]|uniref:uncharacterized protein n=1 Tax=Arthroderma uncinatum TaxID=74035 RepID=UPI00144AB033|nr:uncharacterized protein GIQ15_06142 [Arthroderma uncinatum]KAF3480795.1 hypothetical protein GIQ15_06142 [Arthroderma uncinatum]